MSRFRLGRPGKRLLRSMIDAKLLRTNNVMRWCVGT